MKKVVIIGGGFAGSRVAKLLEKKLEVTLIDDKEYFEFTPGVLRTIVEAEHIRKIQVLHTHYLLHAKVITGCVTEVRKNFIKIKDKKIFYDYLVIASGSSYNLPFKESEVLSVIRAKKLREYYESLSKAKKILIIGGGLVGVELAGEILNHPEKKDITIISSSEELIPRNCPKARNQVTKYLKRHNVKLVLGEKLIKKSKGKWISDKKRKFNADMVFICTGITPNYKFMKKNFSRTLDSKGYIKVNSKMQIIGPSKIKNIFAVGDIAGFKEEKTAQGADKQASLIAKNICALEKGKEMKNYKTKTYPVIISLGKNFAILCMGKFTFKGFIPSLLKKFILYREMKRKRKPIK